MKAPSVSKVPLRVVIEEGAPYYDEPIYLPPKKDIVGVMVAFALGTRLTRAQIGALSPVAEPKLSHYQFTRLEWKTPQKRATAHADT